MKISVVTCVNQFSLYHESVRASFLANNLVQLLPIDNTNSWWTMPSALNYGLDHADASIVVFCHQDVKFPQNWLTCLFGQIAKIELITGNWGVLGTYGVSLKGCLIGNITDPHGTRKNGDLPQTAQTLDEHCLIIRKKSGLRFDEELGGFHLYGADICLQAMQRQMLNFSIDAPVNHLSGGNVDEKFREVAKKFCHKWQNQNCPMNVVRTTCGLFQTQKGVIAGLHYYTMRSKNAIRRRLYGRPF